MLRNARDLKGVDIAATDGLLQLVGNRVIDDSIWSLRRLVIATGSWPGNGQVLMPTRALGPVNPSLRQPPVSMACAQVGASPDIDARQPISRPMETGLCDRDRWSPHWIAGFSVGALVPATVGSMLPMSHARCLTGDLRMLIPYQSTATSDKTVALNRHQPDSSSPRKILTLTGLRAERAHIDAESGSAAMPATADTEILLDEISGWVNEGGAGGEVRRQ